MSNRRSEGNDRDNRGGSFQIGEAISWNMCEHGWESFD